MTTSKKFLIIQTAFLGDVILASSLIEKIAKHYPNAKIDVLVKKNNEGILKNNPFIHKIYVLDKSKKWRSAFSLIMIFRKIQYDVLVNVQRHFTTGVISVFSNAKETIGFNKNPLSVFFTKKIKHSFLNEHEIERNHRLIQSFTDEYFAKPRLYPSVEENDLILPYLNKPFITISHGSVWFTKKLPLKIWSEFLNQVSPETIIYLLGSKQEMEEAEKIKSLSTHPNILNLCGKLNLIASAALMQKAILNFANDSAPTHLATAMNAPIVTVFCSTDEKYGYGPISDKSFIVKSNKHLACRPCTNHGKKNCPLNHFDCGNTITPNQLLNPLNQPII